MNWLVNVYKDKEDVLACGSYMGMELLYNMLWKICKESLKIGREEMWNWQYAVWIYNREVVWQMLFLYFVNWRKIPGKEGGPVLWMTFVDSEEAFEMVPDEVV